MTLSFFLFSLFPVRRSPAEAGAPQAEDLFDVANIEVRQVPAKLFVNFFSRKIIERYTGAVSGRPPASPRGRAAHPARRKSGHAGAAPGKPARPPGDKKIPADHREPTGTHTPRMSDRINSSYCSGRSSSSPRASCPFRRRRCSSPGRSCPLRRRRKRR